MKKHSVGIDIGGSHVCSSVVDLCSGEILGNRVAHNRVDSKASAHEIIEAWSDAIIRSVSESPGVELCGLGVAMPGPFDYEHGICTMEGVDKYNNIFGLDVTNSLLARLSEHGIDRVLYANDASAFALGECIGGAAKGVERVVVLTLGTGLGSGFIASGRPVVDGPDVPANGWVYCLPFAESIADDQLTTRWFVRRYAELTGKTISGAKDVVDEYNTNPIARQIFDEYGRRLAEFIAPVYQHFDGNALVLGGNISQAYELFADAFIGYLDKVGVKIDVRVSSLRDNAAMIGAASLCINSVENEVCHTVSDYVSLAEMVRECDNVIVEGGDGVCFDSFKADLNKELLKHNVRPLWWDVSAAIGHNDGFDSEKLVKIKPDGCVKPNILCGTGALQVGWTGLRVCLNRCDDSSEFNAVIL